MSEFHIRPIDPSESEVVRKLVHGGYSELIPRFMKSFAFHRVNFWITSLLWVLSYAITYYVHPDTTGWSAFLISMILPGIFVSVVGVLSFFSSKAMIKHYLQYTVGDDMHDVSTHYKDLPSVMLVASNHNNEVIGCVALETLKPPIVSPIVLDLTCPKSVSESRVPIICKMRRLFIRKDYRRSGVGTLLVKEMLNHALAQRYTHMYLCSYEQQVDAHGIYYRLGFQLVEITQHHVDSSPFFCRFPQSVLLNKQRYRLLHYVYTLDNPNK